MNSSEKKSLLIAAAVGSLVFLAFSRRAVAGTQQLPSQPWSWGGSPLAGGIIDFFGGQSVESVLANPSPVFQREVLDYRPEGLNYPAPRGS